MAGFRINSSSSSPSGPVGKFFLSLFFLVFLAMGLLFAWMIVRDSVRSVKSWTWKATPCQIASSGVHEPDTSHNDSENFRFDVEYRYTFGGQTFTATRYTLKPAEFSDYGRASRLVARYPPAQEAVCYVNPAAPAEAILHRDSLWGLLAVLFPMIFILIGAGGIYFIWRPEREVVAAAQSISGRAHSTKGRRFLLLFFTVFLLAGCGLSYGFFVRPILKVAAAKHWPRVPCTVLSSKVKSHDGDEGTTYSVDILYRYELDGREHKSNRYHFMGGSSSGYRSKQEIVNRHPQGSRTFCYVNPDDPTEAVLERGFTSGLWFGLIPLAFILAGGAGIVHTIRRPTPAAVRSATGFAPRFSQPDLRHDAGSIELKPATGPLGKLIGLVIVAALWNGIISLGVVPAIKSWLAGDPDWILSIMMLPFALIGLALIAGCGYSFLALFNPRPRLTLTPGAVPLGGFMNVQWELSGRTQVLRRLRIRLEGREEATYRRGTTTTTDRNVFARIEIADSTERYEMRSGSGTARVPHDLMHSFAGKHNKVIWSLRVEGEIGLWPDVDEEFPVTVVPKADRL